MPGSKVTAEIAEVRGLKEGEAAISPPAFDDLITTEDFSKVAKKVREITGFRSTKGEEHASIID